MLISYLDFLDPKLTQHLSDKYLKYFKENQLDPDHPDYHLNVQDNRWQHLSQFVTEMLTDMYQTVTPFDSQLLTNHETVWNTLNQRYHHRIMFEIGLPVRLMAHLKETYQPQSDRTMIDLIHDFTHFPYDEINLALYDYQLVDTLIY